MHPPLFKEHPLCEEQVQALVRCHEERNVAKWFGACNDVKRELSACLREEKKLRVKLNKRVKPAFIDDE
jgi:COX assembly protein 2